MNESPTVPAEAAREDDQPLAGLRVLAVENFIAGPFCSMWLGDAGAEVVKIETPDGGDYSRATSPRKVGADGIERGLSFLRSNRNKKSVTLDLKHPEGKALFREPGRDGARPDYRHPPRLYARAVQGRRPPVRDEDERLGTEADRPRAEPQKRYAGSPRTRIGAGQARASMR